MSLKTALVTGACGLIGSEVSVYFHRMGFRMVGVDNNQRAVYFGKVGDTSWMRSRLRTSIPGYSQHDVDIRDRAAVLARIAEVEPSVLIHTAAQPSHDLAATIPFDDFDVHAVGTLNLLESARRACPESPFISHWRRMPLTVVQERGRPRLLHWRL